MSRIVQPRARKGSQRWLQELLAANPARLEAAIGLGALEWLSPLEADEFAEYQDASFIERLGVTLAQRPLDTFWPTGGPVWDGLARTQSGSCVLIEVKSTIEELASSCPESAPAHKELIEAAFAETQAAFEVEPGHDWCEGHFNYASRLAHACLLNELNNVPAELIHIYFIGDSDVNGPQSRADWVPAINEAHKHLGVLGQLPRYVHDVFVDVTGC